MNIFLVFLYLSRKSGFSKHKIEISCTNLKNVQYSWWHLMSVIQIYSWIWIHMQSHIHIDLLIDRAVNIRMLVSSHCTFENIWNKTTITIKKNLGQIKLYITQYKRPLHTIWFILFTTLLIQFTKSYEVMKNVIMFFLNSILLFQSKESWYFFKHS